MGVFRQFPYSNFHEMNMDEIIKIMRQMQDEWAATKTEWASYKEFIDNYFENLDVSQEVLRAMRIFASDGTLNTILDPVIATETAEWLQEHITPTSPPVDASLSIQGAAADAKAAGDAINDVTNDLEALVFNALNNGRIFITNDWIRGSLDASGEIESYDSRAVTQPYLTFNTDTEMLINPDYRFIICTYDASHDLIARTVLPANTNRYVMPANTIFRMCIYKSGYETRIPNIYEWASLVLINTTIMGRLLHPTFKSVTELSITSVHDIPFNEIYYLNRYTTLDDMPRYGEAGFIFKITFQNPTRATSAWLLWFGYSGTVAVKVKNSIRWLEWQYHDEIANYNAAKMAAEDKIYVNADTWVIGALDSNGTIVQYDSRISTLGYIENPTWKHTKLVTDTGYLMVICEYDSDHVLVSRTAGLKEYIIQPETPIRITLYKEGSSADIDQTLISEFAAHCHIMPMLYEDFGAVQLFHNICGIGDSLMAGFTSMDVGGNTYTTNSATAKAAGENWLNMLGKRNGITIFNEAIGNTTAHDWRYDHLAGITPVDPELFVIGLGVNESRQGLPVGSESDIAADYHNNADTFYGNLHYILSELMYLYPNCRIITFTIPRDASRDVSALNQAIRVVTGMVNGAACVDLFNMIEDYITTPTFTLNYTNDHYNPRIYAYLSRLVEKAMSIEIMNNPIFQGAPYWPWNIKTIQA